MLSTEEICDAAVFIWKIENFSFLTNDKGSKIYSSPFVLETFGNTKFKLELLPRGTDGKYVSCYLNSDNDIGKEISCKFTISLLLEDDSIFSKEVKKLSFGNKSGYDEFISRSELFKNGYKFLFKDILTIRCQLWQYQEMLYSNLMLNKTTVTYEQTSFIWVLKKFNEISASHEETTILSFEPNVTDKFRIGISKICDNSANGDIHITIRKINGYEKSTALKCRVSILDSYDKPVLSENKAHIFQYKDQANRLNFQELKNFVISFFSIQTLDSDPNLYLTNGNLRLHFDVILSSGDFETSKNIRFGPLKVPFERGRHLKRDFNALYLDRKFCDVTLRSHGKLFEAHKIILSCRSSVFNNIFQSKGHQKTSTWVLDISDVESDILDLMLKYIYSEFLEDLEWETAKKLYAAAHKYKIPSLVKECSVFLKFYATPKNLPQLVKLAGEYKDEALLTSVKSLIKSYEF